MRHKSLPPSDHRISCSRSGRLLPSLSMGTGRNMAPSREVLYLPFCQLATTSGRRSGGGAKPERFAGGPSCGSASCPRDLARWGNSACRQPPLQRGDPNPGKSQTKDIPLSAHMLRNAGIEYFDSTACLLTVKVSDAYLAGSHYSPEANARIASCFTPVVRKNFDGAESTKSRT